MQEIDTERLAALLDCLLPGEEGFPPGSAGGAVDWLLTQARFIAPLGKVVAALPDGFDSMAPEKRAEALADVERAHPEVFGAAVIGAYSAYYTRPDVLQVIEAKCGYKAGPPQPGGYTLDAFDPDILSVPKARAASWRNPDEETST